MSLPLRNEELLTPRDFAREYVRQMKRLQRGQVEKLVIQRKGKLEAVVLRVEDYESLLKK